MTAERASPEYKERDILTVDQAAKFLQLSPATVRHYCHLAEGLPERIPHFRLGSAIRIPYWALLRWVAERSGTNVPRVVANGESQGVQSSPPSWRH